MIENSYTSHVGEHPLFFHVTDAAIDHVEAVLIDEHGVRHDMIEFEETRPDGRLVRVAADDPDAEQTLAGALSRVRDPDGSHRAIVDADAQLSARTQVLRESRWGRRIGARIPFALWAEGVYRIEWKVSGVVEAIYTITVLPHRTVTVIENGVEVERLRITSDEQRRLLQLPAKERHAVLAAFTPKGT